MSRNEGGVCKAVGNGLRTGRGSSIFVRQQDRGKREQPVGGCTFRERKGGEKKGGGTVLGVCCECEDCC